MPCPFCNPRGIVIQNDLALSVFDRFPVSEGHMLIIPKRHVASFFETTTEERGALLKLLALCKDHIDKLHSPDGYNIGVNVGEAAGQTIFHLHIHLIPRYRGDMERPRGGVRGVIPERRLY